MSVNSFGYNIIDTSVKSLESRSDVRLTNISQPTIPYGRSYTHHINGPNAPNPNNYEFRVSDALSTGNANQVLIGVTANNPTVGQPFNETFLSFAATEITFSGLINFTNNAGCGTAIMPVGGSIVVSGGLGLQNVVPTSIIMVTQASPNTGGTDVAVPLYVVAGTQQFTINTDDTIAVPVTINWFVAKY